MRPRRRRITAARHGCRGRDGTSRRHAGAGRQWRECGAAARIVCGAGSALMLPAGVRVYVACGVTDMRKGFDGLAALGADRVGIGSL